MIYDCGSRLVKRCAVRKNINSFNVLLFASVGSLLADAHVFFEDYEEIIAGTGLFVGIVFSGLGAYLYYRKEANHISTDINQIE